jgi:hypothetical protein
LLLAGGREHTQWVFLAAEADAQQPQQQADASAAAAAQPAMSPAILAVKLVGNSPTCIDWLESSTVIYSSAAAAATPASAAKQQQQQLAVKPAPSAAAVNRNTAGSSTSSVHTRTSSRRLAVAHQQSNQQQGSRETVVYIRNLILQGLDQANGMWVAVAPDTAEVTVAAAGKGSVGGGAAAAARVAELRRWAGQEQQFLEVLKAHVQRLVGV